MADLLKFTLLLTSLAIPLGAKDYGTHGNTFPVEEEDLIEYIHKRIKTLNEDNLEKTSFKQPLPVQGISEASTHSVHYFNPTIVAKEDIKGVSGEIIFAKGASYNPLEEFTLTQELLFFDGDNQEHLQWAIELGPETKWILVKGNPFDLEKEFKRPIFFDQHGALVKKLSIQSVPTLISQEGKRLKVESFSLKELR